MSFGRGGGDDRQAGRIRSSALPSGLPTLRVMIIEPPPPEEVGHPLQARVAGHPLQIGSDRMSTTDVLESVDCTPDEIILMLRSQAALYARLETFASKQQGLVARGTAA